MSAATAPSVSVATETEECSLAITTILSALTATGLYGEERRPFLEWAITTAVNDAFLKGTLFTCILDGELIGAAVLTEQEGQSAYELQWIGVSPEHQKRSVGERLVRTAIGHAKSFGSLLIIKTQDEKLIEFFEKCGASKQEETEPGIYELHAW